MTRRYIFSAESANSFIATSLIPYLGPTAIYSNFEDIIKSIVEGIVAPTIDYPFYEAGSLIEEYNVPSEHAEDIAAGARASLIWQITPFLGEAIGERLFDVEVGRYGYILITDVGSVEEVEKRLTQTPEGLRKSLMESIDNGDWIPPSMLRMAGI